MISSSWISFFPNPSTYFSSNFKINYELFLILVLRLLLVLYVILVVKIELNIRITITTSSFTLIKDSTLEELPMLLEQPFNTARILISNSYGCSIFSGPIGIVGFNLYSILYLAGCSNYRIDLLYIIGWVNNGVCSKTYWTFKYWLIWFPFFFN